MKWNSVRQIASGKWLTLSEIDYTAQDGKNRKWECVGRASGRGAVGMLATFPAGEIILIRQYRPPADKYVIEFPAGLMDDNEKPEEAAIRELREETGFRGIVRWVSPKTYPSPGLSDEFIYIVRMEVDPESQKDRQTDFDDSEFIETFIVAPQKLNLFLGEAIMRGDAIDAKVISYALMLGNIPGITK